MVIPLQGLIYKEIPQVILDSISLFTCMDKDVETFLKQKAFDFERRNKSRTYLIINDDCGVILGYYTLSLKALPFNGSVSKNIVKNIDGFSKDGKAIGMVLIGQFGKDMLLAKNIDGRKLFNICMETTYAAQKIIGGRFVLLECRDIEKVTSFYKRFSFNFLQYDSQDNYMQMVKRL